MRRAYSAGKISLLAIKYFCELREALLIKFGQRTFALWLTARCGWMAELRYLVRAQLPPAGDHDGRSGSAAGWMLQVSGFAILLRIVLPSSLRVLRSFFNVAFDAHASS